MKTILFSIAFLCLIQPARSIAEFDDQDGGHIATYLHDALKSNQSLVQYFSDELLAPSIEMFTRWEAMEFVVLSRAIHEFEVNQHLEIYLVRFGKDDYNFISVRYEKRQDGRQVSGIQSLSVLDPLPAMLEKYYHLLPDAEPDAGLVDGLQDALRETGVQNNSNPIRRFEEKLLASDPDPPLMIRFRGNNHADHEAYQEALRPQGEPKLLSCRKVTDDVYFLAFFQPTSLVPTVWVFTILRNGQHAHVVNRFVIAGGESIPPYLSRSE